MRWILFGLGLLFLALGAERVWRLRRQPATVTKSSINAVLFSVGLAGPAYSFVTADSALYPFTQALWHLMVCVLIGALELTFLSLRIQHVPRRAIARIIIQSAAVAALLLATQADALRRNIPSQGIEHVSDHDATTIVYLVVFPAYVIWGLSQPVFGNIPRIRRDLRRRPINTIALLLVTTGIAGFIIINATVSVFLNVGRGELKQAVIDMSPAPLFICGMGAALLAVGERMYDEITARVELLRVAPLWQRAIDLSEHELHLSVSHLSTPARLQRAYVEISDALCTIRLRIEGRPSVDSVVAALQQGSVTDDPSVPTVSQALPERTTRAEDLRLINALAITYRRHRKLEATASM